MSAWHDRAVAISIKHLNRGEEVVLSTHEHLKALLFPTIVLIVLAAVTGYLTSLPSGDDAGTWRIVILVIAAAVVIWWVVIPFLRWLTSTYVFTDRRLITREGLLTRRGHDIPLTRISDIAYEKGVVDRIFGCGTLIISDASETGRVELHDIPRVEEVQLVLNDLVHDAHHPVDRRTDDGT